MKKILLLFFVVACFTYSKGQVIVTLQIPQEGLSVKPQLWNAILVNTGNSTVSIKINLLLTDLGNGQQVLSATSSTFSLPQGSTNITAEHLLPISYTVLNNAFNIDQSLSDFIPIGSYSICYQVLEQKTDAFEEVSEECESVTVEPLSPPILTTPDDEGEIEESRPLFTWTPPAPLALFSNLTYKYNLVEVLQGQSSSDAIQQNVPILQQNISTNTFFQYPITLTALDTGKNYAWQIIANGNNLPVSNSEIWTFKIKSPQVDKLPIQSSNYIKLKQSAEISFTVCFDYLRYEYLNESNDSLVTILITDISANDLKPISLEEDLSKVGYGENYMEINLSGMNLKDGHYYLLKLTNGKKENWYTKFQFKKK